MRRHEQSRAIILDFLMPNGKAMRECTFGYVREIGGRFAAIGALRKARQVIGDVLTDEQAQAAYASA
jgi:hypothetical protein